MQPRGTGDAQVNPMSDTSKKRSPHVTGQASRHICGLDAACAAEVGTASLFFLGIRPGENLIEEVAPTGFEPALPP